MNIIRLIKNILEKIKDELYSYLNKISGGTSNEETISNTKKDSNRDRILVESRINKRSKI